MRRADQRYCSARCKQSAHRKRNAQSLKTPSLGVDAKAVTRPLRWRGNPGRSEGTFQNRPRRLFLDRRDDVRVDHSDTQETYAALLRRDLFVDQPHADELRRLDIEIAMEGLSRARFDAVRRRVFAMTCALLRWFREAEHRFQRTGDVLVGVEALMQCDAPPDSLQCMLVHLADEAPVIGSGLRRVEFEERPVT
jgi:hypothetical protein